MAERKDNMRILLTEQCNANCVSCFNKNIRTSSHMDFDDYGRLLDYLFDNGIVFLKIMGGEPTVHPQFEEAIRLAQEKFAKISIFTNALNDRIKNISMREADFIVYNYLFINQSFDLDKLLLEQPGGRILEVQISSSTDVDGLCSSLGWLFSQVTDERVIIGLTLDCMENIFAKRDEIIERWNKVALFILTELKRTFNVDHSIPWCFFESTDLLLKYETRQCNINCAGLITTDLRLQHCNQCQDKGVYLKKESSLNAGNGFVPYEQLMQSLRQLNDAKIQGNIDKACSECAHLSIKCNGGCFMHKSFIRKEP